MHKTVSDLDLLPSSFLLIRQLFFWKNGYMFIGMYGFFSKVRYDFITWFKMFMIIMVSGGIAIQATLYPNYPFTEYGITMALSRALFAMFLTKIDDLDGGMLMGFFLLWKILTKNINNLSYCRVISKYGGYFFFLRIVFFSQVQGDFFDFF